jgi:predicted nucleic acid-binding protein
MKSVVIDASVVIGYLINSNKEAAVQFPKLLSEAYGKRIKILSLNFLPLEVANGLRYSKTDREITEGALTRFTKLPLKLIALSNQLLFKAVSYAYVNKTTVYDTAYHLLAISRNSILLTCDRQYYSAAGKLGNIQLLS